MMVVVEVDQGGERRGMRTHCRNCAHSPARPQAGSISTAAAVQQRNVHNSRRLEERVVGSSSNWQPVCPAAHCPWYACCVLAMPLKRASGPAGPQIRQLPGTHME